MARAVRAPLDPEKVFVTKISDITSFGLGMRKQDPRNERLDDIGLRLLDAARLQRDEIDTVASAPNLFDGVKKRIALEGSRPKAKFGWVVYGPALRTGLVSVSVVAVLLMGVGVFLLMPVDPGAAARQSEVTGQTTVNEPTTVDPANVVLAAKPRSHEIVAARYVPSRKKRPRPEREEMSDFYALTYDDDTDNDVRIIRVELPRSSLLAMGINAHAENESEKVKADLVVGADGVTRAVRFAK